MDRRHVAVHARARASHRDAERPPGHSAAHRDLHGTARAARGVLERDFHEEKITGEDKTVDVVVDIFNRVNSGGTKLSKGDLALAKKCAHWPEARAAMRSHLEVWQKEGFAFSLDWLLRNTTAVATGRAEFASLDDVPVADFKQALRRLCTVHQPVP